MRLYTLLGAGTLVLGAGMFAFFTTLYDVPAALLPAARTAFAIVVLNVACGFVAQVPLGILAAHHDFVVRNAVQVGGVLLRVLLTLVLLTLDASIVWLAVVDATVMVAEFAAMCAVVRRRYPGVRLSPAGARWSTIRAILSFSVFVLVLQVGSRLTFKSDALVVGAFLTLAHVTFYAVANSIAVYVMEFLVAIGDVAMPTVARLHHQQRNAELQQLFLKWSKIAFSVTLVAVLFLGVAGPRVIAWWVDPTFEEPAGAVLRVLMLSNLVFLPVRSMALPVLMGLGRPQRATIAFLVAGVLNLALSIALVGPLGLVGVALGTAIPNVLVAGYVLHVTCEALSLPLPTYLRYVGGRALLGAVPVLLALLLVLREFPPQDFLALFAVGVATLALSAVVAVAFVYRGDPNVDIRAALPRLLSWRRA